MSTNKEVLKRGGASALKGGSHILGGLGHAFGAVGQAVGATVRTLENIVSHGGGRGLEETGKGIGYTLTGTGYVAKGAGRLIRGTAKYAAHAGGNVRVPTQQAAALCELSPTMMANYGTQFQRTVQRRKPNIKIYGEDYEIIMEEAMQEQARRAKSGPRGYAQAAAVLFFILSAFFLASTTPSITGYSILQAGAIYSYFPFFGAVSLIIAFILLLTE